MEEIKLNDILRISNEQLKNTKIRFNLMFGGNWNPIEIFKNRDTKTLLEGQYWNYSRNQVYQENDITIGFIRIKEDKWLLFHIGKVTKRLNILEGVGYEYQELKEYEKYIGRLIIQYKNTAQTMIRKAVSMIDDCKIFQILPNVFDDDIFPGYENVNVSWKDLSRVLTKSDWQTALENQKGVYLITDISKNKRYVGAAYGKEMILGRWKNYIGTGHGGNVALKDLNPDYIKEYFRYSILDIFKSTTNDDVILKREKWWKEVLLTQNEEFGYNKN